MRPSATPSCAWQGVLDAFRSIARKETPAGLFRGLGPTVLTNAPFSALYYMFYKQLQTRLTKVRLCLCCLMFEALLCAANSLAV